MIELLKRSFDLFVRKQWLKTIDKEVDKFNNLKSEMFRQQFIIKRMLDEYNKIYGDNLGLAVEEEKDNDSK